MKLIQLVNIIQEIFDSTPRKIFRLLETNSTGGRRFHKTYPLASRLSCYVVVMHSTTDCKCFLC